MADRESKMPRPVRFIGKSIASASYADYAAQLLNLTKHTEQEFKEKFELIDIVRALQPRLEGDGRGCFQAGAAASRGRAVAPVPCVVASLID